uniref:VWFD domain-containing protein n=1 Tax=Amphilophus citrinellus TaxID=61819 RepID=A0A3Q0T0I0_AMPCI
ISGIMCNYSVNSCTCIINGKIYNYGDTIYNTTDGLGNCITAQCDANGIVTRNVYPCLTTTTPGPTTVPFTFSTIRKTTSGTKIGPLTSSASTVLEKTTSVPGVQTTVQETRTTTKGYFSTTTVRKTSIGPVTQTLPGSTTVYMTGVTTSNTETTTVATAVTSVTPSTNAVVEKSTPVPGVQTTGQGPTVVTSRPSVSTSSTNVPFTTTREATSTPSETAA